MADLIGRKLVVVGDCGVGKPYTPKANSRRYGVLLTGCSKRRATETPAAQKSVPTMYDNYIMELEVDGAGVELGLWDTPGNGDYDRLRPLIYPKAHVILLCFAIDSPNSLANAQSKWMPEVRHHCPEVPVVLGKEAAEAIGAVKYLQCSAKGAKGVRELFQYAAKVSLQPPKKNKKDCSIQ
ncbi:Rho1 GTPase [Coprinopsis cinerea okayama7|uniref:Rho1 GTPase n=1 Tax=Coprinopsis cinerea (strain Okayama-7 / 130 / ATCC MYA-4618 / FGSC 9003) TaxID=240176 RepID=A8PF57_COPC7|nr:Rho1 GTPase [Coprinopsis cinerea okayama7\|eukprot:XP_001840934.2 Rho1 GTPase [Coprinopsis cinerea okayama7\